MINDEALNREFARLEGKLNTVEGICKDIAQGKTGGLVLSGPPGVGKTYSVMSFLAKHKKKSGHHYIFKGKITPFNIYPTLYRYRETGDVVVFDDADINDLDAINLLKAAGDTTPGPRLVSYESTSVDKLGIDRNFMFSGGIVILTNKAFEDEKRMRHHYAALSDRLHNVRLANFNKVDAMMMIYYMTIKRDVLKQYNFTAEQVADILCYIRENKNWLKHMSLRTLFKIADEVRKNPTNWTVFCDATLLDDSTYGDVGEA